MDAQSLRHEGAHATREDAGYQSYCGCEEIRWDRSINEWIDQSMKDINGYLYNEHRMPTDHLHKQ